MALSLVTAKAALVLTLASVSASGALGCVYRPLPTSRVASSEAAIRTARELGADQVTDAAVHLELAQRQLDEARRAIDAHENDRARWLLVRADVDAHLALALIREQRTREAAEEMTARVRDFEAPGPR